MIVCVTTINSNSINISNISSKMKRRSSTGIANMIIIAIYGYFTIRSACDNYLLTVTIVIVIIIGKVVVRSSNTIAAHCYKKKIN